MSRSNKILIIIPLSLLILASFGFVGLKFWSLGPDSNYFNQRLRPVLAQSPFAREIFGLHFDGDGAGDYLGGRYDKIIIEVDSLKGISLSESALELLQTRLAAATGKSVSYIISDSDIAVSEAPDKEQLVQIAETHRNFFSVGKTASVYLLYAGADPDDADLLGSTLEEWGVIVYENSLEKFVQKNSSLLPYYEESTALHELGHQIGLTHNEDDNCLMNSHAEKSQVARESAELVVTDFCPAEKELIELKKKQL